MKIALLGGVHSGQTIARRLAAIGDDAATGFDHHPPPMQRLAAPKLSTAAPAQGPGARAWAALRRPSHAIRLATVE